MRITHLFLSVLLFSILLTAQDAPITIDLTNGNSITGAIISEDSTSITLQTAFGELVITRDNIASIGGRDDSLLDRSPASIKYDQEARWRTIYSSMLIGNSIYGIGIPYVLGVDDFGVANGMRLLLFGGGFYASLRYTKQMDLPMGRWQFQMVGAELGGFSILPLMAIVGYDNWDNFDPDGKIAWTWVMTALPYGVWKTDQLYVKWRLTNGQSSLVAGGVTLGTVNTIGLISTIHSDNWDMTENLFRFYTVLTYAGALAGGRLTKNLVTGKSYTEDDAEYVKMSATVGFFNGMALMSLLDIDNRQSGSLVLVASTNAFIYLADRINRDIDLDKGQGQIIALGTGAAYLTWRGLAFITDLSYDERPARLMDIASVTAGWYFTHQWMAKRNPDLTTSVNHNTDLVRIEPTIGVIGKSIIPVLHLELNF